MLERLHGQQESRVELLKIHMNTEKEGEVQKENKLFEETIVLTKAIMAYEETLKVVTRVDDVEQ